VLLYTASTLYHSFRKPDIKQILKIVDHSCIYILIAGTYTPFMLVVVRGVLGWSIFAVVWSLTILGILFKIFFVNRFKIVSTLAYILMGWLIVFATEPLLQTLPDGGIAWLVPAVWPIRWEQSFTPGKSCPSIMPSGTYLFWPALLVILWLYCFMLYQ